MVCGEILQVRQEKQESIDIIAKCCLSGILDTSLDIVPIQIELVFLSLIDLEHSASDNTNVDSAHNLLTILHHDFLEKLTVDELIYEPTCTANVLVDIGLQVARHIR